jgi:hypothetical protein
MRVAAVVGLGLYGIANVFAAAYDLETGGQPPLFVDLLVLGTGLLLLAAMASVAWQRGPIRSLALIGLVLAFLLAVYNERVLGLGDPFHHLIRGAFSLAVLWAVWRSTRAS